VVCYPNTNTGTPTHPSFTGSRKNKALRATRLCAYSHLLRSIAFHVSQSLPHRTSTSISCPPLHKPFLALHSCYAFPFHRALVSSKKLPKPFASAQRQSKLLQAAFLFVPLHSVMQVPFLTHIVNVPALFFLWSVTRIQIQNAHPPTFNSSKKIKPQAVLWLCVFSRLLRSITFHVSQSLPHLTSTSISIPCGQSCKFFFLMHIVNVPALFFLWSVTQYQYKYIDQLFTTDI